MPTGREAILLKARSSLSDTPISCGTPVNFLFLHFSHSLRVAHTSATGSTNRIASGKKLWHIRQITVFMGVPPMSSWVGLAARLNLWISLSESTLQKQDLTHVMRPSVLCFCLGIQMWFTQQNSCLYMPGTWQGWHWPQTTRNCATHPQGKTSLNLVMLNQCQIFAQVHLAIFHFLQPSCANCHKYQMFVTLVCAPQVCLYWLLTNH